MISMGRIVSLVVLGLLAAFLTYFSPALLIPAMMVWALFILFLVRLARE
jgi:hypothetical protein